MNPKYTRVAERLTQLISKGVEVANLELPSVHGRVYIQDNVALHAWLVSVDNIVRTAFGPASAHFIQLSQILDGKPSRSQEVNRIVGILHGALSDLEGGFLVGQERLVAGVVFDIVLQQAHHLLDAGFKDSAAVLCRVVIEDCLRRLSREEGLSDTGKASALNDATRDCGRYGQPQWRMIQAWLDIGNAAAHGKFSDFDHSSVAAMIEGVERFMAQELGT